MVPYLKARFLCNFACVNAVWLVITKTANYYATLFGVKLVAILPWTRNQYKISCMSPVRCVWREYLQLYTWYMETFSLRLAFAFRNGMPVMNCILRFQMYIRMFVSAWMYAYRMWHKKVSFCSVLLALMIRLFYRSFRSVFRPVT